MCFNFQSLKWDFGLVDDHADDPRKLERIYENDVPIEVRISLMPIEEGQYVVKRRIISPRDGSLLWEWKKFDFDDSLSSQEIKYIRQICFPRIHMIKQTPKQGVLEIHEKLGIYDVILIHIYEE